MKAQPPVHPDDMGQLLHIRRYLIGFRITNGWNQDVLSRKINGTNGMVHDLESNQTWQWRLSRLQGWPVPFGLRLTAQLIFPDEQLMQAVESHPEVAPAFSLSQTGLAWPKWQRIYLMSALAVARKESNIGAEQMGARLGVTRKAIWNWENASDELMLPKVLHYARTLGGFIELGLERHEGKDRSGSDHERDHD